jgi:tetratricopeptide (TPR) repeat protein
MAKHHTDLSQQQMCSDFLSGKFVHRVPYLLLFFLLLAGYFNSFQAEWHFDDVPNILLNSALHISDLSPASIKQTFFAYPEHPGTFLRPVSNLTFALNWFFHQDSIFGYHLINFFIHLTTALFLYQSCLLLLNTPVCTSRKLANKYVIAGLAAIFWAVNPVQTQAVTYIVQRMAALAAMFTIIGVWCFLKARMQTQNNWKQIIFYFSVGLSFLLAVNSKENAIVFPASIILIEFIFFQQDLRFNWKIVSILLGSVFLILLTTIFFKGPDFFLSIAQSYNDRDFTMLQRVLTEARIVIFYLSLLFYPAPFRLSLIHDFQLSHSLFDPLTTLAAVFFLGLLTILPLFSYKRFPLTAFAILFFLLNHIVESTILNLELIFEHRNYLPSLFLFLPVAASIATLLETFQKKNKFVYISLFTVTIFILIFLVTGTFSRNKIWLNEKNLWTDAMVKAPNDARPYINLGYSYLQENRLQEAFKLNLISLDKAAATPWKARFFALNNLGNIMVDTGNYDESINFFSKAAAISKADKNSNMNANLLFNLAKPLWLANQHPAALETLDQLIKYKPKQGKYLQRYGEMLIADGQTDKGLTILQQVLDVSKPTDAEYKLTLLDLSLVYAQQQSFKKAAFFLRMAGKLDAPNVNGALCLLEISLLADKPNKADQAMRILLSQLTWPALMAILEKTSPVRPLLPLNHVKLHQYALKWLTTQ